MKKEVAKKWVKSLRSGKYKQGEGCLKQTNLKKNKTYHCCLGVLCELYNEQMTKGKKKKLNDVVDKYGLHTLNKEVEILPDTVRDWADLKFNTGGFIDPKNDHYDSLAAMNDLGCSFKEIANTIEKEWKNL